MSTSTGARNGSGNTSRCFREPLDVVMKLRQTRQPILVAAAVDYKIVNGVTPGGLGRKVAEDIHQRRIIEAALAKEGRQEEPLAPGSPGYRDCRSGALFWRSTLTARAGNEREHRQSGGSILMGRGALKEYLWGLRRGYLDPVPLDGLETEERLSQYLEKTEDVFADSSPPSTDFANDDDVPVGLRGVQEELARSGGEDPADWAKVVAPSTPPKRGWLSSLFGSSPAPHPTPHSTSSDDAPVSRPTHLDPLHHVPPQPALLLVPFDHPIGMKWWPLKLLHFFNHRARVRAGGEAAIALICNETESLIPPRNGFAEGINPYLGDGGLEDESMVQDAPAETRMAGETGSPHLDFGLDTEPHTYRGYASLPATLLSARRDYLASLPPKLATARQLARGEREPTKDEGKYPPPTEVELRAERVKKERKWREDRQGWEVVRKGSGVVWDERMEGALTVVQKGRMVDEVLGQKQQ